VIGDVRPLGAQTMFATLTGTDRQPDKHESIMSRLCQIARQRGYEAADNELRIRPDGNIDGWTLIQKGPPDLHPDFILAVTAPKVPGCSPIYPVFMEMSGPMFAVVVLQNSYTISVNDGRRVHGTESADEVATNFEKFLDALPRTEHSK
jgi:hypothetical protein